MHVCMCVCMHVCMCACMCACIYIYIYIVFTKGRPAVVTIFNDAEPQTHVTVLQICSLTIWDVSGSVAKHLVSRPFASMHTRSTLMGPLQK